MKIAIIGSGISGLVCANKLHKNHDITVFEKNSYVGGHTNTVQVEDEGRPLAVDTGFIVFNKKTYPNFLKLIEELGVSYQKTSMSFSVQCESTGLEYNGTSLNALFAQRRNLFSPRFLKFVHGITQFNAAAKAYLQTEMTGKSLGDFIREQQIAPMVISHYLIPMAAAVWSADPRLMWEFPAEFILRFWKNHGFLEINDRPQWYVIQGGSKSYIEPLCRGFKDRIRLNAPVEEVIRDDHGVKVKQASGQSDTFDKVIFACHSNQTRNILQDKTAQEESALASLPYQRNVAILHTDDSTMPRKRLAHAAWNYVLPKQASDLVTVHYNMNILQTLNTNNTYVVSLNTDSSIDPKTVIRSIEYDHPIFTPHGMSGQKTLRRISGKNHTFFCGAYMRYGFHEDGVMSALHAVRRLEDQQGA